MKFSRLLFQAATVLIGAAFIMNCHMDSITGQKGSGNAKTETRNISGFKKIAASGAVHVEVSIQKDFSVTVEADDNLLGLVKTETSGDTLKIYTADKISTKTDIKVKISMPSIENLDISAATVATVTNVKADSLEIKASSASKVKITGEAKTLKADASSASSIDAENLKTVDASVEASSASSATVSAANELKAKASGASSINYVGDPKSVKQDASDVSSVNKK